jgi:hypothetical protein
MYGRVMLDKCSIRIIVLGKGIEKRNDKSGGSGNFFHTK